VKSRSKYCRAPYSRLGNVAHQPTGCASESFRFPAASEHNGCVDATRRDRHSSLQPTSACVFKACHCFVSFIGPAWAAEKLDEEHEDIVRQQGRDCTQICNWNWREDNMEDRLINTKRAKRIRFSIGNELGFELRRHFDLSGFSHVVRILIYTAPFWMLFNVILCSTRPLQNLIVCVVCVG
jgi:hypothetical protein